MGPMTTGDIGQVYDIIKKIEENLRPGARLPDSETSEQLLHVTPRQLMTYASSLLAGAIWSEVADPLVGEALVPYSVPKAQIKKDLARLLRKNPL